MTDKKKNLLEKKSINELTFSEIEKLKVIFFDFDGVFTDNKVLVSENGEESVFCFRGDGIGLSQLFKNGFDLYVISSEVNPVVKRRCEKLKINCLNSIENKGSIIKSILKSKLLKKENAAFLGNDINDIQAFQNVSLTIGVNDRNPLIDDYISYVTHKSGGNGAVREVCDKIISLMGI
jgi:YrbI family 3-deoxy-D-manno-octulosonate 8-phosphate phosphatase